VLVAACDSPWLLRIRKQLVLQGERYRRTNIRMSGAERDLRDEHTRLAEAVLRRDVTLATERMTEHLRLTETLTLQSHSLQIEVA
jgi:DNA-binding GntR family transcriptional regulator